MGLTRTHLIGVFVVETALGLAGMAVMFGAVVVGATSRGSENVVPILLFAACLLLVQIGVLLSSMLSLLFWMGPRIERAMQAICETERTP